jgi:hypothetical protein
VGLVAVTVTAPDEGTTMNVSVTTAPARTDVAGSPAPRLAPAAVRRHGLALTAGATAWSVASLVYGFTPDSGLGVAVTDLSAFAFQLGVLSLVQLQLRTRATGVGRAAVTLLKVERVLLALAMAWSLLHGLVPSARDDLWLAVLDVFWPLSMLGMLVIGVKVAVAGRWRGVARFYPLVAESWVAVTLPALAILGPAVGETVGALHLLVGYAALGLVLATRPHEVLPRG